MCVALLALQPGSAVLESGVPAVWASTGTPVPQLDPFISGLDRPVFLTTAGADGRLFIVEQNGTIRIVKNGALLATPFLDISSQVRSPSDGGGNEEGLLGLAFPPDYSTTGQFFVYYTYSISGGGNNRLSRFSVSANADQANSNSEQLVLDLPHPTNDNHNGGMIGFGPDGYLYIGTGDGGMQDNAQETSVLLGKILRIDVRGAQQPYAVPPGNPFSGPVNRPEIWHYGLRNPWRFSFDRGTGEQYIADVGQGAIEELDREQAGQGGRNFGWSITEGRGCYPPGSTGCDTGGLTLPVLQYAHSGGRCSITGGYVYRGLLYPRMRGLYFFADFCSGEIWGVDRAAIPADAPAPMLDTTENIVSFGEDARGELYVISLGGAIYRLVDPAAAAVERVNLPLLSR